MSQKEFLVERDDDGKRFVLLEVTRYHEGIGDDGRKRMLESRLKGVASPDGRGVFADDEGKFFFADEPDRPMSRLIGPA